MKRDVPYGNDWDSAAEVSAWAEEADRLRPWRARIRDQIAGRVAALPPGARVLELGSGPGFLAHRVLERCPELARYTLVDFSEPMLALSRAPISSTRPFTRARPIPVPWVWRVSSFSPR